MMLFRVITILFSFLLHFHMDGTNARFPIESFDSIEELNLSNQFDNENDQANIQSIQKSLFNFSNEEKDFVLFTMPKTGTHLMQPLLAKMTGRKDAWASKVFPEAYEVRDILVRDKLFASTQKVPIHWFCAPVPMSTFISKLYHLNTNLQFLSAHAPFSKPLETLLLARKYVAFFVVRDPRDYVMSIFDHVNKHDNVFILDDWFYSLNTDEQIYYLITGTAWYNSAETVVKEFIKWKDSPACCTLRFEKLIGPSGGACTAAEHIRELRKIANALEIRMTDEELLEIFKASFGQGYTFNKAKVGRWKTYFNESHKKIFKQLLGNELIELGYEKDHNW